MVPRIDYYRKTIITTEGLTGNGMRGINADQYDYINVVDSVNKVIDNRRQFLFLSKMYFEFSW